MRSYGVTAYFYIGRQFVLSASSACYSMLQSPCYIMYNNEKLRKKTFQNYMHRKCIYIADFDFPETKEYQRLLISVINEITPCELVSEKHQFFIKFKMLKTYDQSLILLNFIRNLWYEPYPGYSKNFFESLKIATQDDPLERLTWANKESCKPEYTSVGHCNVHKKSSLKVKKEAALRAYQGNSTYTFLTTV